MREIGRLAGALAASLVLVGVGSAHAATLKGDYRLQGSRAAQVMGAPDLVDLGSGNRFVTETVDGVSRQVLAFPRGGGVSLDTAGLVTPGSFSVVMTFRLAAVSDFRRLLDFSGGDADRGLYDLDGRILVYPGAGPGEDPGASIVRDAYVQVALTSETTDSGAQWSIVYVNGSPVSATTQGFRLGAGSLRLFKDNVRGPAGKEESAGALACLLVFDGALSAAEVKQQAAGGAACPAPRPSPPPSLPYRQGVYRGTTSQGLPITFTVGDASVDGIAFRWRARCADGRVHVNGIFLGGAEIRGERFSVRGLLGTGGRARVSGRVRGSHARGTLSRWAGSAFDTECVARGIRWRARHVRP